MIQLPVIAAKAAALSQQQPTMDSAHEPKRPKAVHVVIPVGGVIVANVAEAGRSELAFATFGLDRTQLEHLVKAGRVRRKNEGRAVIYNFQDIRKWLGWDTHKQDPHEHKAA